MLGGPNIEDSFPTQKIDPGVSYIQRGFATIEAFCLAFVHADSPCYSMDGYSLIFSLEGSLLQQWALGLYPAGQRYRRVWD